MAKTMVKTRELVQEELRPEELAMFALPERETLGGSSCYDPCGALLEVRASVEVKVVCLEVAAAATVKA